MIMMHLKDYDLEFLSELVESMLTGVYVTDEQLRYIYANKIFTKTVGYSLKELRKMRVTDLVYKEDFEKAEKIVEKILSGEAVIDEIRYVRRDGEVRWVFGLYKPLVHKGKMYAIGNYVDITKAKELESKLKENEEFYRGLIDNSLAIVFLAQNGKFIFANAALSEITGYSMEELLSMDPFSLVHPEDREEVYRRYIEREAGIRGQETYSFRIIRKDRAIRWLSMRATRILYNGEPAVYATAIDTTRINELNESLARINEYFSLLSKMLRHDIMNDLTVVKSAIELRDEKLLDKALQRLESVVEKIKETKTLEEALGALKLVNVAEIAKGVVEKYKGEAIFRVEIEEVYVEANEA
ncbi:MAG: PAS domain S-box protein, partial [Archaeoglobales archaeon]|nr:PAS domain S-box protein [Archaeoglobales archaeon]